jgi:hypothetical protein
MFLYGVIQMPIQKLLKKEVILVEEGTLYLSDSPARCGDLHFCLLLITQHQSKNKCCLY